MKAKLLRKIRSRFKWTLLNKDDERYRVFDTQNKETFSSSDLPKDLIYLVVGFFTYLDWLKKRSKRKERAEYLRWMKYYKLIESK